MMKKIVIAIMICLFTSTMASYADFFRNETSNEGSSGQSGSLFGNSSNQPGETSDSSGGGLFRSSNNFPGDRPGSTEGIGQEAPLRDGIWVLVAGCVVLVAAKTVIRRIKK
jgi:hypothetical protein